MTPRLKTLALLGLCLSVTVAGCGRKGGLEDPSAPEPAAGAAVDPAVAAAPPQAPPQNNEPFFLDFLIQ